MSLEELNKAIQLLSQDEVVCIPTETVYGMAANLYSEKAIEKIYTLKGRPRTNPLIVHIGRKEDLKDICKNIPLPLQKLIDRFWPGPLTVLVEKADRIPLSITAGGDRVGVRMPNHPLTLSLLQQLDFPLVAPSANPYNAISPTTAKHVKDYFGTSIPLILDGGPCQQGLESTVVGMEDDTVVIYRLGMITAEQIETLVGKVTIKEESGSIQVAPGMSIKHYAPKTPTLLCDTLDSFQHDSLNKAFILFSTKEPALPQAHQYLLSEKGDLNEAAARLYDLLHALDKKSYAQIVCKKLPDEGIGRAINDRLKRASSGLVS
ncbi:MAG: threonylcarbamoyl-AMP synthase [Sphingomonadales bacterium]|nr:threonylcarbamoyl-AMP synthase [Sphingomonadales bacterium]